MRDTHLGFVAAGVIAAALFPARPAVADTKQECSEAYENTQLLRDAGKLEEGIKAAGICSRDVCASFIRDECAKWKAELEGRVASIIVEAVDATGTPVTDGSVSLDGEPWLDQLGGPARTVAKGVHTLEITTKGAAPQKKEIVVREGEQNRKITISIASNAPPPEQAAVHRIGPWVVGGIGVATLIGGAVTGGFVLDAYSVTQDQCDDAKQECSQEGLDAQDRGQLLGPVTTGLLVGGGALVAAGIIWLVVAPSPEKPATTSFFVAPAITADQKGFVLGGRW